MATFSQKHANFRIRKAIYLLMVLNLSELGAIVTAILFSIVSYVAATIAFNERLPKGTILVTIFAFLLNLAIDYILIRIFDFSFGTFWWFYGFVLQGIVLCGFASIVQSRSLFLSTFALGIGIILAAILVPILF